MGVTAVYIIDAVALDWELWVAARLTYLLGLYNKIRKETTER